LSVCQNWDISRSRDFDTLADAASPKAIADAAVELGCASVAFTYNDPVVFLEYAVDVADACRERGIKR
jgi:pyruvate formate lyase activating enzyme